MRPRTGEDGRVDVVGSGRVLDRADGPEVRRVDGAVEHRGLERRAAGGTRRVTLVLVFHEVGAADLGRRLGRGADADANGQGLVAVDDVVSAAALDDVVAGAAEQDVPRAPERAAEWAAASLGVRGDGGAVAGQRRQEGGEAADAV